MDGKNSEKYEYGKGKSGDIEFAVGYSKKIEGNTICPLGDAAAWPVACSDQAFP